jgi:hypothetical protein
VRPTLASVSRIVQQYNICGSVCTPTEAENAMLVAGFVFNADNAVTISLNEVCASQYAQLIAGTTHTGGIFHVTKREAGGCEGEDSSFGIALIVRYAPERSPT